MRAVIQRVTQASCIVDGRVTGACGHGFLILLGVTTADTPALAARLWAKIAKLRIFEDDAGKTNRSLADVAGEVLIISQFTLYADCSHGNRPGFTKAARPTQAVPVYEHFVACAQSDLGQERVGTGIFGASMQISLINDGPFTVILDTEQLGWLP